MHLAQPFLTYLMRIPATRKMCPFANDICREDDLQQAFVKSPLQKSPTAKIERPVVSVEVDLRYMLQRQNDLLGDGSFIFQSLPIAATTQV